MGGDLLKNMMGSLSFLDIQFNPEGWGPKSGEKLAPFYSVPYAHFDKKDKCHRPADFVPNQQNFHNQRTYQKSRQRVDEAYAGNADFAYKHDNVEDSSFQLVDTSKTQTRRYGGRKYMIFTCSFIF